MKELSVAEWNIMESLWEEAPKIGSSIVADLQESVGWSRSTTLTMLRRMTDKGLIECRETEHIKQYSPLIEREAAVKKETENFLKRVYRGSVSMMLCSFVEKQQLSKKEIEELYEILKRAEGKQHD